LIIDLKVRHFQRFQLANFNVYNVYGTIDVKKAKT